MLVGSKAHFPFPFAPLAALAGLAGLAGSAAFFPPLADFFGASSSSSSSSSSAYLAFPFPLAYGFAGAGFLASAFFGDAFLAERTPVRRQVNTRTRAKIFWRTLIK